LVQFIRSIIVERFIKMNPDTSKPLGEMDEAKANRFVLGLIMPKIKRAVQSAPKRFAWDWTDKAKRQFISKAIGDFLDLPANAGIKNAVNKSRYREESHSRFWHGSRAKEMRFLTLADKFKNVIN